MKLKVGRHQIQKEEGGNVSVYVLYVTLNLASVVNYENDVLVSRSHGTAQRANDLWNNLKSVGYR